MKPVAVALVLLAILAAAMWLLLGAPGAPASLAGRADRPVVPDAPPPAGEAATAAGDGGAALIRSTATADAAANLAAAFPGRSTFHLQVLDEMDRPLPFAALLLIYSDGLDLDAYRSALDVEQDLEQVAARFGYRAAADAAGEAVLPRPAEWLYVVARAQDRYGVWYYVPLRDGPRLVLRLAPDLTLRARLLDETGMAVPGAPLALLQVADDYAWSLVEAGTDAEGRAVFRHVQERIPSVENASLCLSPGFPLAEPPRLTLDRQDFPREEVVLRVPALGRVRVEVFSIDGQRRWTPVKVAVQRSAPDRPEWQTRERFFPNAALGLREAETRDGSHTFEHVGLGLELEIGARFDDGRERWRTEFHGPTRAGEEVSVRVQQTVLRATLLLQPVLPDGQPLAGVDFHIHERTVLPDGGTWGNETVRRSDAEGRIRHTPSPVEDVPAAERWLDVEWRPPDGRSRYLASLRRTETWTPGDNDLGVVRLEPMEVFAAGRVMDEQGQAVAGATLDVERWRAWGEGEGQGWWNQDWNMRTLSQEDGSFTLYTPTRTGRCQIVASHPRFARAKTPLRTGAQDHAVVLRRGRFVVGKLLVDAWVPSDALVAEFGDGDAITQTSLEGSGALRRIVSGALGPDPTRLTLRSRATEEALFTCDGLTPGERDGQPDPRLDPADLRGALKRMELTLVDEDGIPVRRFQYGLVQDGKDPTSWHDGLGGRLRLLSRTDLVRLRLVASGFRSQDLALQTGDNRATMRPHARLVLRLAAPGLASGHHLSARLDRLGGDGDDWLDMESRFDASGSLVLRVGSAGRFRVTPVLFYENAPLNYEALMLDEARIEVEVPEAGGSLDLLVPLTLGQIEAVILRYQQQSED